MTEVFYMHRMAGIQLYGVGGIGAAAQALTVGVAQGGLQETAKFYRYFFKLKFIAPLNAGGP